MIYFKEMYITQAKKIIEGPFHQAEEIKEFSDIRNDLKRIAQAERHLHSNSGREAARQLNSELREKYPIIDQLLDIADRMPRIIHYSPYSNNSTRNPTNEAAYLQQDRVGILCHVLMKKNIIREIEEYIDYVD